MIGQLRSCIGGEERKAYGGDQFATMAASSDRNPQGTSEATSNLLDLEPIQQRGQVNDIPLYDREVSRIGTPKRRLDEQPGVRIRQPAGDMVQHTESGDAYPEPVGDVGTRKRYRANPVGEVRIYAKVVQLSCVCNCEHGATVRQST